MKNANWDRTYETCDHCLYSYFLIFIIFFIWCDKRDNIYYFDSWRDTRFVRINENHDYLLYVYLRRVIIVFLARVGLMWIDILYFIFNFSIHGLMFNCVRNMHTFRDIYHFFIRGAKNAIRNRTYETRDHCLYNYFVIFIVFFSYDVRNGKIFITLIYGVIQDLKQEIKITITCCTYICDV